MWTREEALASIVTSEIIDLPAPLSLRRALQKEFSHEDEGIFLNTAHIYYYLVCSENN